MILTNKQEEGLKIAIARYKANEKYTCIAGYAGVGKSTLIKFIIEALNIDPDNVVYVAYTGKAANVLKNKGCKNAITAHKLLYHARLMANGKYKYSPRKTLENNPRIVIVDEVSMLPKDLWELLCTHNTHIIALGDPAQLPPIDPSQDNHILDKPHIFLDQVMRQAQESEIIRLSMHVREGKPLATFPCINKDVMLVSKSEVSDSMLLWPEQILCATNNTRISLNKQVRNLLNYPADKAVLGDKVINLHNEWEIKSTLDNPLTNGIIGQINSFQLENCDFPYSLRRGPCKVPLLCATISGDEPNETFDVNIDYNELLTGTPTFTGREEYLLLKRYEIDPPLHFNYGYAITTWKAQGSEFSKVILYNENWPRGDLKQRYLYTGITRAIDRLVVVS